MLKKLKETDFIPRLQVFLMIFLSAGNLATNVVIPVGVLMGLWALLILSMFSKAKNNYRKNEFGIFFILAVIVILSDLVNGERFSLTILMVVMLVTAYLFVVKVSLDKFAEAYLDVMAFLSITSLIGYTACLTIPSLQYYNLTETGSRFVANFYIYVHAIGSIRNFGFFWEPGAFQAFLSIALLFEIYRKRPSILRFLLFFVTSVTTFSTTGYISLGLIALFVLMKHHGPVTKLRKTVIVMLPLVIFLIVTNAVFLSESEGSVFGKITAFMDNKDYIEGGEGSTASVRYFAIIKPIEEFVASPLLGCGYENLQKATERYTGNMNTCTFVNFFAIYGVVYGVIMIIGYWGFSSLIERKRVMTIFLFSLFFMITMSENMMRCPLFIILPLYGISMKRMHLEKKPFQLYK